MSYYDQIKNIPAKTHTLIIGAIFEVFFLYFGVTSFMKLGIATYSLWWLSILVKIGLGYLTYRLYSSQKTILAIFGAVLALLLVLTSYITFWISPNSGLSLLVGGYIVFLFTSNTFFIYRYFKNRAAIKLSESKYYFVTEIFQLLVFLSNLVGYRLSGLGTMLFLILWILFYLKTEGYIKPMQQYRDLFNDQ
jgi:hypothetical protein